jgi:NADH:ubiquinone oxidoreductase subunit 2 (subunit N)
MAGWRFAMSMMMFSLAGIPPLAGFWAKWYVFLAAIEAKLYVLAVIGVVTSVVGAYYYLRIVKVIYFDDAKPAFDKGDAGVRTVLLISAAVRPGAVLPAGAAVRLRGRGGEVAVLSAWVLGERAHAPPAIA